MRSRAGRIFVIFILACSLGGAAAESISESKLIRFDREHSDLGLIERNKSPRYLTFDLWLTNPTEKYRKITETKGNCSCFTVEKTSGGVPPLGNTSIRVTIDKYSAKSKTNYSVAVVLDNEKVVVTSFSMNLLEKVRVSQTQPVSIISNGVVVCGKEIWVARTFAFHGTSDREAKMPQLILPASLKTLGVNFDVSHVTSSSTVTPQQTIVTALYKIRPLIKDAISFADGDRIIVPISIRWDDDVAHDLEWEFLRKAEVVAFILDTIRKEDKTEVVIALNTFENLDIKEVCLVGARLTNISVDKTGKAGGISCYVVKGVFSNEDLAEGDQSYLIFRGVEGIDERHSFALFGDIRRKPQE
jgi:hypothetical protein